MRYLVIVVLISLVATPALAGPPTPGVYSPADGLFSESWNGPPYQNGILGNTIHAASWDGTDLGLEWLVSCPGIQIVTLVSDTRDGDGYGTVTYSTDYVGGTLWLSKDGPWGDGTEDYLWTIDEFVVVSSHQYTPLGLMIRSNITMQAHVGDFLDCLEYSINNAEIEGSTDYFPMPAHYPAFLDPTSCTSGVLTQGAWGNATQIGLVIYGDCTVPVRESTWGHIKSIYND